MIRNFFLFLGSWKTKIIIKRILKKKIIFSKINQYDLLILDEGYANLDFKNICSFKVITNEIYFSCLLKAIFKSLFFLGKKYLYSLSNLYLQELVKKINPKVIISHDFKYNIFNIKKYFPKIFTIIYQFSDHDILHKKVLNQAIGPNLNLDEFRCDVYLSKHKVFNSLVDFIKAKFLTIGSVKNNEMIIKDSNKKVYDVMMVSQYRPGIFSFFGIYNPKMMFITHSALMYVTNIISSYCKKKNKKLCIAKSSSRKEKQDYINKSDEINFFSKILNSKKFYEEDIDSYQLSNKSELIVTTYSTLGLELLSRGKKVLFIDPFYFLGGHILNMFTQELEGPHWYCGHDPLVIEKKIEYLLNISDKDWKEVVKNSPLKIDYDPGNKTLKELVKNRINVQKI